MLRIFICCVVFPFGCLLASASSSVAQTKLTVQGSGKLYPIAVPKLCRKSGGSSRAAKEISDVITKDLDLSGFFDVLNPGAYIEASGDCSEPENFAYSDWSIIGVDGLVRGVIEGSGSQLTVRLYLHDVQRQRVVLGKEYSGSDRQIRSIAHKFANAVVGFFTGSPGVFGTQIIFSGKIGRFKELFLMDMDGSNIRQLTNERGLALSTSWVKDGESLLHTAYVDKVPNVFEYNLLSNQRRQITQGPDLALSASYSNDEKLILMSQGVGRGSDIVLTTRDGDIVRKLTKSSGVINVSPDWSPDNKKVVFVSNRSGGPQIYTMDAYGGAQKRISFVRSKYCTSPAWSPSGKKIAFVCRADRGHQLFVSNPDGTRPQQLTSYGTNEDPDWSPDGRYIVFATTFGRGMIYNLALIQADGSNLRQLTFGRRSATDPAWGPLPK